MYLREVIRTTAQAIADNAQTAEEAERFADDWEGVMTASGAGTLFCFPDGSQLLVTERDWTPTPD